MRSAVKKTQTPEEEISGLVAQADAVHERADELLDLFAEKVRPRNMPRDSVRRIWEAKPGPLPDPRAEGRYEGGRI